MSTRYGPTLELRELGANKVLAIFARAEPRDFVDLAELTKRILLRECIAVAAKKDPGLDLAVLDEFMARVHRLPGSRSTTMATRRYFAPLKYGAHSSAPDRSRNDTPEA